MQLIRGLHNTQPYLSGCALTIGNFDGVHLGHQAILRHLRQKANALNLPMAVMLFSAATARIFYGQQSARSLNAFKR